MFSTRTEVKREPCRRCQILRVYLAMILGVIVFGVLARDLLDGLAGLTPQMFGYAFAGLPVCCSRLSCGHINKSRQINRATLAITHQPDRQPLIREKPAIAVSGHEIH